MRRDRVVNISDAYAENSGFKSQPGNWLSRLRLFVECLSLYIQIMGWFLASGHDRFQIRPNSSFIFQLIIHSSSYYKGYRPIL